MSSHHRLFWAGVGVAIATAMLPFLFPRLPEAVAWTGAAVGVLMCIWGVWPSRGPDNLADLSVRELQKRALDVAAEVRKWEAATLDATFPMDEYQRRRQASRLEYNRLYRSEMRALCDEVSRRLGLNVSLENRPLVLDSPLFAGVSPATEAADYLERLARRLS